jgi:hypothetical protein
METVSPFNLTLNVALSGVLEFGASLTPKAPKKKVDGRYATDLLLQCRLCWSARAAFMGRAWIIYG